MFDQEKTEIIDKYLTDVKATIESVNMLRIRLEKDTAKVVSSKDKDTKRLEAEIEGLMASYKQKELAFRSNLIALYKKYNKPHPLELEEAIEKKEGELKRYIDELLEDTKRIDKEVFEVKNIDPLIYTKYYDWSVSLNFDDLKKRYKDLAKNPSKAKDINSQLQEQIIAALKVVIENRQ